MKFQKTLIICAVVLIALAVVGLAYVALDEGGAFGNDETTAAEVTTAPETAGVAAETEQHDDYETELNEYGLLTNERFYENNILQYSIDYVYGDDRINKIQYDENDELVQNERFEFNLQGEVSYYCLFDPDNNVLSETNYIFYEDNVTVWKETSKFYEADGETATVKFYSEDGLLTDLYTYENDEETGHTVYTYDEDGNLLGEETAA